MLYERENLDPINLLKQQFGEIHVLTHEEMLQNLKVARDKKAEPKKRLGASQNIFIGNFPLVLWRAKRFTLYDQDLFMELIQGGSKGLAKAVRRVVDGDNYKKYAFSTIAVRYIENGFKEVFAFRLRMNKSEYEQVKTLRNFIYQETQLSSRVPTPEELANLPEKCLKTLDKILTWWHDGKDAATAKNKSEMARKITYVLGKHKKILSLEEPLGHGDSETLGSIIPSPDGDPFKATCKNQLAEEMKKVLSKLNSREEKALKLIYGIDGGTEQSRAEVGRRIGRSRERIRQIEQEAFKKLRSLPDADRLKEYL